MTKGQVLVDLEPFDLLELEREAIATLAARTAEFERLKAGLREEEKGQAKARYERLQARLQLLENGPRPQEIEAAKANLEVASSRPETGGTELRSPEQPEQKRRGHAGGSGPHDRSPACRAGDATPASRN